MFSKLTEALRGARKAELMLMLALMAVLALALVTREDTVGATDLEKRLENALRNVEGAGNVQVVINEAEDGEIIGVLVVAEGAADISVKLDILSAVRTLMGVESKQIEIARMRGDP